MITEEQRRALFALREALHLCEGADIFISPAVEGIRIGGAEGGTLGYFDEGLRPSNIDAVLQEHPE